MGPSGITLADVRAVLDAEDSSSEPVTASEVAAELGCDRRTAREALDELVARDGVETKEVGDGVRVWWATDRDRRRYEAVVETVNDGIYVKDEDNRFTLVNDTYAEMVGHSPEELVGRDSSFLVSEEVMEAAEEIYRDLRAGDDVTETVEATMETPDGETIETEASFAVIPRDDEHERVGVVRDVTDRKERERRLERQNERLESFASMLAHELRNPVTIGQIYSQQLPADADDEAVDYVTDAFDRIDDVIDVLLVLARGQDAVGDAGPVRLDAAAREAWGAVDSTAGTLAVSTDRVVRANETYLRHFLENLFENAIEHGTDDRSDADVTVTVGDAPDGFYVADDGVGVPAEDRDAVFEAGYTTAASSGGTGVGLTFVRELADVYDWECSLTESEAGGARFEFSSVTFCTDE
ncbi:MULTISPECIES: PAS domain-containing sensor histidine kinase [Halorussus]|uniref:PAS domain-containing sensor histidine kinase n=1 Tax=Halorussus TaxID=1070314 RepID=UPI000E215441|nr:MULTISPECIES: PAS domain-containing sensor histidine kinase [Halorussus]NHN58870.1 PAS domain S-box protein [Halorussus sp. JP-T4]